MRKSIGSLVMAVVALFLIPISTFAVTGISFGGRIVSVLPCTCSPYTRITFISSQGKTAGKPMSLDYFYGSQMFSKYNLPLGRQILGKYVPGPLCLDYKGVTCIPRAIGVPASGTITPFVGSSL